MNVNTNCYTYVDIFYCHIRETNPNQIRTISIISSKKFFHTGFIIIIIFFRRKKVSEKGVQMDVCN